MVLGALGNNVPRLILMQDILSQRVESIDFDCHLFTIKEGKKRVFRQATTDKVGMLLTITKHLADKENQGKDDVQSASTSKCKPF